MVAGETITRADSDLVVTVYALRTRGLVETIKTRGAEWTAELTEAVRLAAGSGRVPTTLPTPQGRVSRTAPDLPADPAPRRGIGLAAEPFPQVRHQRAVPELPGTAL